jgi:hypothetical protein
MLLVFWFPVLGVLFENPHVPATQENVMFSFLALVLYAHLINEEEFE